MKHNTTVLVHRVAALLELGPDEVLSPGKRYELLLPFGSPGKERAGAQGPG